MTKNKLYIEIAELMAGQSKCLRSQVGAIIVKDNRIISTGYNGVPADYPHCKECLGPGCNISIHAEMNAIAYAARNGVSTEGATIFTTMSPCEDCIKAIIASGITKVVYKERYRKESPLYNLVEMEQFRAVEYPRFEEETRKVDNRGSQYLETRYKNHQKEEMQEVLVHILSTQILKAAEYFENNNLISKKDRFIDYSAEQQANIIINQGLVNEFITFCEKGGE